MKAASKRRNGPMPSPSKRKKMSMFLARRRRQSESVSVLRSSTWMSTSAMRSPLAGVETEDEAAGEVIEVASAGIGEEDEVVEMVSEGVAMAVIAVLEAEERLPSMSPTKTPFPALEAHSPDRLHHPNCSHRWYQNMIEPFHSTQIYLLSVYSQPNVTHGLSRTIKIRNL